MSKKEKKTKSKSKDISTTKDIIPIRSFNLDLQAFVLEDGTFLDMYEIVPSDRSNLQGDELNYNIINLMRFFRLYSADVKFISMSFPMSTSIQRKHLEKRLKKSPDEKRNLWLRREINELRNLEMHTMRREYYLMFFGRDKENLLKNKSNIEKYVGYGRNKLVESIDMEKKIQIVTKLNNMNTLILPDDLKEIAYDED